MKEEEASLWAKARTPRPGPRHPGGAPGAKSQYRSAAAGSAGGGRDPKTPRRAGNEGGRSGAKGRSRKPGGGGRVTGAGVESGSYPGRPEPLACGGPNGSTGGGALA